MTLALQGHEGRQQRGRIPKAAMRPDRLQDIAVGFGFGGMAPDVTGQIGRTRARCRHRVQTARVGAGPLAKAVLRGLGQGRFGLIAGRGRWRILFTLWRGSCNGQVRAGPTGHGSPFPFDFVPVHLSPLSSTTRQKNEVAQHWPDGRKTACPTNLGILTKRAGRSLICSNETWQSRSQGSRVRV
jgi:hypothetical protein